MTIGMFDYLCAECANFFEVFVRSDDQVQQCPRCKSASVARQPVMQMAFRTSNSSSRKHRVVDMSSNSCPCGCASGKHAHAKRA